MAADHRSTLSNPFGYTFPSYPANNDPPAGPPLLDHDESSTLQNFFDDPDHFGTADAFSHVPNNSTAGSDSRHSLLNTDAQWLFPTDQTFSHAFPSQDQSYTAQNAAALAQRAFAASPEDVLALVGIPSNGTPDDVLHAASTLFMYRANQIPDPSQTPRDAHPSHQPPLNQTANHSSFSYAVPTAPAPSMQHQQHQQQQSYPSTNGQFRASFDNTMGHHPQSTAQSRTSSTSQTQTPMYHFGSDNNFRQTGYAAPYQGLEDSTTQTHIDFVRGMVNHNSAMSSMDNSVSHTPDMSRGDHKWYSPAVQAFTDPAAQRAAHASEKPNARKRRKTRPSDKEDSADHDTSPAYDQDSSPAGDSQTVIEVSPDYDLDDLPSKATKRRRTSSGTQGKSANLNRKNLTDEQKRSNHIRSEQKRRNIIKQGYEDLNNLVPNLKTGGFSKSAVLSETTRFLEELQEGNNRLEHHLRQMAASKGLAFEL